MGRQRRFSEHLLIPFLVLLFAWPLLAEAQEGDETYQTVVRASAPDLDERSPRTSKPIKLDDDASLAGLGQALGQRAPSTLKRQIAAPQAQFCEVLLALRSRWSSTAFH